MARDAGRRTAEYVIANRIPRLAALLIGFLPRPFGRRLLLSAIRRNSWTFAGSGECGILPHAGGISIAGNPLSMPGGIWHVGVLETMFRELVASVTIRHVAIIRDTIHEDRFEIA